MKLYQLLTEAKKMIDVSATLESVAELLTQAGIHKSKLEDLRCRLSELAPVLNGTGSVYNRDWVKLKESLILIFNEAFEKIYFETAVTEDSSDEWYFSTSPHFHLSQTIAPQLSTNVSKNVRQLNSSLKQLGDDEASDALKLKLKKLKQLAEAYAELIEAQRIASEKVIAKRRQAATIPANLLEDSNFKLIVDSLKDLIAKPLNTLEKDLKEEFHDKITRLRAKIKRLDGKVVAPGHDEAGDLTAGELQLFIKLFDYESVDSYSGKKAKTLFVNIRPTEFIKSYAAEKAKKERDEIEATFIAKNANKLLAIIKNKKEAPSIEQLGEPKVTAGSITTTLKFIFPDGAHFTVINKVTTNRSPKGEAFYQYPITFHNVRLSDGTKISSPSEDKMLTQFK